MKTNKRPLLSVLFPVMMLFWLSWLLLSQDRVQISQQNPRSQQSMEDELAALRAIATANKKAIDDNKALGSTSDATKLKILDSILGAIPPILLAFATVAPILWKLNKNDVKTAELVEKTKHIEILTNSTASELAKVLAVSQERVSGLEKQISMFLEREKVDLAKQQMPPGTAVSSPPPAPSPAANGQTDRIEETGKDTNTRAQNIETHVTDRVQKVEAEVGVIKEKEKEKT